MDSQEWNRIYSGPDGDPGTGTEQVFLDVAKGLEVGSALDLGCGPGALAIALGKDGWRVTAIDFSETAIERARARSGPATVDFQVADIAAWTPPHEFDLVVSAFAMPPKGPVRDRLFVLARESLAPNGLLVIAEWDTSMAEGWGMSPDELASTVEVIAALPDVEIQRSRVLDVEAHGRTSRSVFVVATRSESTLPSSSGPWRP